MNEVLASGGFLVEMDPAVANCVETATKKGRLRCQDVEVLEERAVVTAALNCSA